METFVDDKMSLFEAFRRAKSVNLHKVSDAMSALTNALRRQRIQCYSDDIETWLSEHCWVFPKQNNPFYLKEKNVKASPPDYYRSLLIDQQIARDIAYEKVDIDQASTLRHEGQEEIFVYTGIYLSDRSQDNSCKIAMYGTYDIEICANKKDLILERFYDGDRSKDKFLPYMRNSVYSKLVARNVRCSRANVEMVFPYSIDDPKRKVPGRPSKYRERAFAYLDGRYPRAAELPVIAEMIAYLLDRFESDDPDGKVPGTSTWYEIIGDWRKVRIRDSGN